MARGHDSADRGARREEDRETEMESGEPQMESGEPETESGEPERGESETTREEIETEEDAVERPQPELRWVRLQHPKNAVEIGANGRILDSRYHLQYDSWEVLLETYEGELSNSAPFRG